MCTSSYGISSASVSAMRSSSASRLYSERTSWKISARRRYGSTAAGLSAGGGPPVGTRLICGSAADRKSTRLNSSHTVISYAVFCLKKKKNGNMAHPTRRFAKKATPSASVDRSRGVIARNGDLQSNGKYSAISYYPLTPDGTIHRVA